MIPDPPSLLDLARARLGKRLTEHRLHGYILDGRPVTAMQVIEAGEVPRGGIVKAEPILVIEAVNRRRCIKWGVT